MGSADVFMELMEGSGRRGNAGRRTCTDHRLQLPCRVERDTGATGLDFFNNSSPVLFGEIAFPSTRGRPELEARVKEEVMTWGGSQQWKRGA